MRKRSLSANRAWGERFHCEQGPAQNDVMRIREELDPVKMVRDMF